MTDHFKAIYTNDAARYDAMVSREDYQGNLLPALQVIYPLDNARIVELGAGTGRLTRLLAPVVGHVTAFDAAPNMLDVARNTMQPLAHHVSFAVANNRHMPVASDVADVVIAGWSLGHAVGWYPDTWMQKLNTVLDEMFRIVNNTNAVIILETMGTGNEVPASPNQGLADYYHWLENEHGFVSKSIRTDYQFASVEEADHLLRFFFGDDLAGRVVREQLTILPECTGIWWKSAD